MQNRGRFLDRRTGRSPSLVPAVLLVAILVAACSDGDSIISGTSPGPYHLSFSLDASFHTAHGGQPIRIAAVRTTDGIVVAQAAGTVSESQDPSFSFAPGPVLERGVSYEVHYWIDSNIGGGTAGVCDPKAIDHQWSVEFFSPSNDVNFTVSHNPMLTEGVCTTFD